MFELITRKLDYVFVNADQVQTQPIALNSSHFKIPICNNDYAFF